MRISPLIPIALAALVLAGCDREDPEKAAARQVTARTLCVAEELALQAKERLASLDTVLARARGTPMEATVAAGYQFAFALRQHADAAVRSAALLDSAMNAPAAADSARYAELAVGARPAAGDTGSVEANAATRFRAEMAAALSNPYHPCNRPPEE